MLPADKILRINSVGLGEKCTLNSDSARTLSEYWAVIVDPVSVWHIFNGHSKMDFKRIEDAMTKGQGGLEDGSFNAALCERDFESRRQGFKDFFAQGGLLVCFVRPLFNLTTPKDKSGKSYLFGNYDWLYRGAGSTGLFELASGRHGTEVNPTDSGQESCFADYLGLHSFLWKTCVLKFKDPAKPAVLATNVVNEAIAFSIKFGAGKAVFLPLCMASEADDVLMRCVEAEVNALRFKVTEAPPWTAKYIIPGMAELQEKMAALQAQIERLQKEKELQEHQIKDRGEIRDTLLAREGRILKETVESILKEFGFNAMPGAREKEDIVIKAGKNTIALFMVKGTKSSAIEADATQLDKWVSAVFEEEHREPKGILLVNAFQDKDPLQREKAFANLMIPYCQRREFCLFTTAQLFNMYCNFRRSNITGDEILNDLMSCIGVYEKFQDFSQNLVKGPGSGGA
ncbi:MAG: hypothetical protein AMS15_09700 [Planctomycetes bacterium DG_23]|nr:MAG: hypothetical protein AMS15_09700 [Planctomycetes bacterium DG_23]